MRKKSKVFSGFVSLLLIAVLTCTTVFATVSEEESKLSDLNKQKQEAESQKEDLEASKSEAEEYIQSVDSQLTSLATDIYATKQQLKKTRKKIKKTKKKLTAAEESINQQYDDMKLRIQYMYENGDTQILDLLLNSSSISEFLNKAEYITELSQYDRKMLNKMKETKQEIAEAEETLEENEASLVALQEQQESDQTKLEKLSAAKEEELATYEDLLEANEASAEDLEAEISAQEAKVAAAEQASIAAAEQESIAAAKKAAEEKAAQKSNEAVSSGSTSSGSSGSSSSSTTVTASGYIWPCPGYTTVSSDYGYRSDPFSGTNTFHSGIDIPAPSGTPVVAAGSGTVEWASYSSSAGNWIGINHGNGVYTIYMHMSALLVSAGTTVSAGDTIGLVGTTGSSTGNHLHFSVRVNGSYVSPWNYVSN